MNHESGDQSPKVRVGSNEFYELFILGRVVESQLLVLLQVLQNLLMNLMYRFFDLLAYSGLRHEGYPFLTGVSGGRG
jgi:hypothetical protein